MYAIVAVMYVYRVVGGIQLEIGTVRVVGGGRRRG